MIDITKMAEEPDTVKEKNFLNEDGSIPNDVRTSYIADKIDLFLSEAREDKLLVPEKLDLKKIHNSIRFIRYVILIALMTLCLFTRPPWCSFLGNQIDEDCINGPDATIFYKSAFPLFAADAMGRTATILMFLITCDQFFIYSILKGIVSENQRFRRIIAFTLLGLTLTHFLFDIMEQTRAITFRLSELNRTIFLSISIFTLRTALLRLIMILWRSREIIVLFLLNWLFFSAAARVFFQSSLKP
jgi:hypothetical protein